MLKQVINGGGKSSPRLGGKLSKFFLRPSLRFAFQLSRTANDHRMFFVLSRQLKLRSSDVRFAIESALVSVSDFGSDKDSPERRKSFNEDNKRRRIALTSDRKNKVLNSIIKSELLRVSKN